MKKFAPQALYITVSPVSPYSCNKWYDRMPEVPPEQRSEFWMA
ncbi:MAG: hypothetical protein OSJ24_00645 [Muribaculaceae bacterium]|nr:hypothetical protein [Muribaculaceae bacterium]